MREETRFFVELPDRDGYLDEPFVVEAREVDDSDIGPVVGPPDCKLVNIDKTKWVEVPGPARAITEKERVILGDIYGLSTKMEITIRAKLVSDGVIQIVAENIAFEHFHGLVLAEVYMIKDSVTGEVFGYHTNSKHFSGMKTAIEYFTNTFRKTLRMAGDERCVDTRRWTT